MTVSRSFLFMMVQKVVLLIRFLGSRQGAFMRDKDVSSRSMVFRTGVT